jgi:septal ring-binding cell division protein DamX
VVKNASPRSFTIQLLVACSNETVDKAVQSAGGPELFVVPVNYRGRGCLRLCWGLYDDEGRATSAIRSMPDYFVKGGARPRVVPASELLR